MLLGWNVRCHQGYEEGRQPFRERDMHLVVIWDGKKNGGVMCRWDENVGVVWGEG